MLNAPFAGPAHAGFDRAGHPVDQVDEGRSGIDERPKACNLAVIMASFAA